MGLHYAQDFFYVLVVLLCMLQSSLIRLLSIMSDVVMLGLEEGVA